MARCAETKAHELSKKSKGCKSVVNYMPCTVQPTYVHTSLQNMCVILHVSRNFEDNLCVGLVLLEEYTAHK